jgi:chemotaxis protein MotB
VAAKIIVKKTGGHGGHHGGAWKVAYADFVTAMMALFIVLWLMNSSKQVQEAVGGYFRDPNGTSKLVGVGTSKLNGNNQQGAGESLTVSKDDMQKLKEELQNSIRKVTELHNLGKQIEMTVTSEGLRIELLESAAGTFFDIGNATPSANAKELLKALAEEIGKLPNHVSIEGHTDSKPYGKAGASYSNWELSSDRANAARRIMAENGMSPKQVSQVRGYADQRLRHKEDPEDPGNRRISLIVEYLDNSGGRGAEPKQEDHASEISQHAAQPAAHAGSPATSAEHTEKKSNPAEHTPAK